MKINISGQVYEQREDGGYDWKSEESESLLKALDVKKNDGTLKAKYKDLPRYKLIVTFESYFKNEFSKTLKEISKETYKFLKQTI